MADKIKVLIVDDMLSIRMLLQKIISSAPDMEVVGSASNPLEAREILKNTDVDVITLDVEMPDMDGITFLGKIMKLRPTPVVMVSTLTHSGTETALRALELGAIDVVGKPSQKASEIEPSSEEIVEKVRAAASAKVGQSPAPRPVPPQSALNSLHVEPTKLIDEVYPIRQNTNGPLNKNASPLIVIGSSTGGPTMLRKILPELSPNSPPALVVQHMSTRFIKAFAQSLDEICEVKVLTAQDSTALKPGHVYFASDQHLAVKTTPDGSYKLQTLDLGKINRHRPSVDLLFRSAAQCAGHAVTAVLLTGMGDDGARCLKELKDAGARTLTQNEATCIVYGMPRAAMRIDSRHEEVSIDKIVNIMKEMNA